MDLTEPLDMRPSREKTEHIELSGFARIRKGNGDVPQYYNNRQTGPRLDFHRSFTFPPLSRSSSSPRFLRKAANTDTFQHPLQRPAKRRPPYQPKVRLPTFKALNRTFDPIPHLIESNDVERNYKTRSMDFWEKQVKKEVPKRPAFSISNDYQPPPATWDDRDPFIFSSKSCFYDNKKHNVHRDFMINPEWVSESMKASEYSPAYRTCALRYGWNC